MSIYSYLWSFPGDCVLCGSHPYPCLFSPPPSMKLDQIKWKKSSFDDQSDSYPTTFKAKVHYVPLATPGQKAMVSRQVIVPPPQLTPPPPGSFRKEVSAAAKCRVNRAGGGGWGAEVGSPPPPSTDQSWGSSMPGLWSKGAGSRDEPCVSVIWTCPDPIVSFHNPEWSLPVLLITLGRRASLHWGAQTKEALPCPSAIWSPK